MRSYMKIYVTRDQFGNFNGVVGAGWGEGPYALERYHKNDALGNMSIFFQPGFAGVKTWGLWADQQDGRGERDTGLRIPTAQFAFQVAYNLQPYSSHPLD